MIHDWKEEEDDWPSLSSYIQYSKWQRENFLGRKLTNSHRHRKAVLQIHDILVQIRIRGSMPLTNGFGPNATPDPAIFVIDLQDANKKLI
jgi:hypothetical protein